MKRLAIIPARGGSRRIPGKNIKDFHGKPIIAYSIETALSSKLFDEVMVSTDDEEIARVARSFGAQVPFMRSEKNADDFATTLDVINEVISTYKTDFGVNFDFACCIYPTAPLINSRHLKEGLDLLESKEFHTVFPVVAFGYPIWRGLERNENGNTQMLWPEYQQSRSQDLKPVYHDAGQWYWLNLRELGETIFNENSGSITLSEEEVQDIDNPSDWKLAEMKYALLQSSK